MLSDAGVPTTVLVAPLIPALTDAETETILERATAAGARSAGYVLLRLPLEVRDLFGEWLAEHAPGKREHVLSLLRQAHGGKEYNAQFGTRMCGSGEYADMIAQRFQLACKRLGLNRRHRPLDTSLFRAPHGTNQLTLF